MKLNLLTAMRKVAFLFLFCLFAGAGLQAQQDGLEIEPTEKIVTNFEKKYIGEKLLFGWRKVGDLYIIPFQHKSVYKYCAFTANGFWQEAGESIEKEKIPENVYGALPELDMTAFIVECFTINTYNDQNGFMILYETESDRIEFVISNTGKILRKNQYPIPEKKEEDENEKDANAVEWDDGK